MRMRIWRCGSAGSSAARPVAFDAVSGSKAQTVTTLSWFHTCKGENRLLAVSVSWIESVISASGIVLQGITYNGVPLTFKSYQAASDNNEIWYLVDPPAGTFLVTITMGGPGIPEGGKADILATSMSFREVNQASPLGTALKVTGFGTAVSVSVTGVSDQNLIFDSMSVYHNTGFATRTVGALPQLLLRNDQQGSTVSTRFSLSNSMKPSAAGVVALTWTLSAARDWIAQAVEVKAA